MKQAMILAAGLGTRLRPLTDTMPKALVKVNGKPLIDIVVERLLAADYDHFVVNVHHFAQQLRSHLDICGYASMVKVSDETEQLLETGGALKHAAPLFLPDVPILIHNVDILDNVDYDWFSRQHLPEEDAVLLVSRRKTKRYLLFDNAMRLMGWTNVETGEVKSPYPWLRTATVTIGDDCSVTTEPEHQLFAFAFSGIHSFSPRLFPLMDRFPDRFSIIDFYLSVCHRARIVGLVKTDLQVLDVGKPETLQQANMLLSK